MNAKRLDADLSKLPATSENTTWSWNSGTSTGTFGWTATSYNSTELFGEGNYSAYTTLNFVTTTGTADHFRVILRFTNGKDQITINPVSTGTKSITLSDYATAVDLANIQTIRLSGANDVASGNITVTSIYLEGPDINYIESTNVYEAPAGTTDFVNLKPSETNGFSGWASTVTYPKEFAVQGNAFGNGDGSSESEHVDIDGYDYLHFIVTGAQSNSVALRVWLWNGSEVVTLYAYPIAEYATVTNWKTEKQITATGTYVVKVSGYKYLKGVKAANNWGAPSVTVSMAYASKGTTPTPYLPTGKYTLVGEATGSITLNAALADASATLYDATGLTNTSAVALNPTNPNAFFVVNDAAKLSNTKNVLVKSGDNYSSSNIELVDDKPFKAPFDITSTASSYTRNLGTAGAWGSVVLPFALDVEAHSGVAKFYMFESATETTAKFYEVTEGTIFANSPFIYQATGANVQFEGTDIKKTISGYHLVGLSGGWYQALSMEEKVIDDVTTDDFFKDYDVYGISGEDFVHATKKLTLKPFRAFYLKTKGGGEAPARLAIEFEDDVTAIAGVNEENAAADAPIYNVAGQQVDADYKGIVIKNGKKYLNK